MLTAMPLSRTARLLPATLLLLLLAPLAPAAHAAPGVQAGPQPSRQLSPHLSAEPAVHDAFYATLRLPPHGACVISKSDAQPRARLACRDGWATRVRACPQEDSRHCFWHAPSRGNGVGRSFVAIEGKVRYFRG